MKKPESKKFRVYVAQVNQNYVVVEAPNITAARRKGYAKWRREMAHAPVIAIEAVESEAGK